MTKPIDLIVANAMHEFASKAAFIQEFRKVTDGKLDLDQAVHEAMARQLLCNISHGAHINKVYDALKAAGAPCSADDMREGVKAAAEAGA